MRLIQSSLSRKTLPISNYKGPNINPTLPLPPTTPRQNARFPPMSSKLTHTHTLQFPSPSSTPPHPKTRTPTPHTRPPINSQAIPILPLTLPLRTLIAILLPPLHIPLTARSISAHTASILRQTRVLAGLGDVGTGVAAALAAFLGGIQFQRVSGEFPGDVIACERWRLDPAYAFPLLVAGS